MDDTSDIVAKEALARAMISSKREIGGRKPPKDPPTGPARPVADNDPMEARVAKLEAAVDHIQRDLGEIKTDIREVKRDTRTDFRLLFGAIIAVALGLAGLMAKGFHWL